MYFIRFYKNIIKYLDSHFDFTENNVLFHISKLCFLDCIDYKSIEKNLLIFSNCDVNIDQLHNEISQINEEIPKLNPSFSIVQILMCLCQNGQYDNFERVVCFFFCIPISNSHIERSFSMLGYFWNKERNSFVIDTLESQLKLKYNLDYDCISYYKFLKDFRRCCIVFAYL